MDDVNKDVIICCLKEQISEISLLQSMYAVPEELEFSDDFDLDYLNRYTDGLVDVPPAFNEFCVKISICPNESPIEITFYLSLTYPKLKRLNAFVRCNSIKNQKLIEINTQLRHYLLESELDEPKIFDCLTFIRENMTKQEFISNSKLGLSEVGDNSLKNSEQIFERFWIYSHHIYNKFKRRSLLNLASQLNLTGFSVPGKPGVICVEGLTEDCQEFWDSIKVWSWQQIALKHREKSDVSDGSTSNSWRKFENFKEIPLDGIKSFLQEHKCSDAFSILFGFRDKPNAD